MSYFGGLGAGKGWNKFKFILTPNEFENIFVDLDYWFVITNTRVPIDYSVSDKKSLFSDYEDYFNKIFSGKPFIKKNDWKTASRIHKSITNNVEKIEFKPIVEKNSLISTDFKHVTPMEPVINVAPFSLWFTKERGISLEYMDDERNIGLELNYPKFISLDAENHTKFHSTEMFSTSKMFLEIQRRVKNVSRKAKIRFEEKLFRPNFWISQNCIPLFEKNFIMSKERLCAE